MDAGVVLGLDTATAQAAVAATRVGETLFEQRIEPDPDGRPRHSELLLPTLERVVAAAGGWPAIELIGVGIGPGSYTGLRIGVATARALAQARKLPLAGVSTLAALGRAITRHPEGAGRPALPVLDARRGQAFAALYRPGGEELRAPFVCAPEELCKAAAGLDPSPLAAGDGAIRFRDELEAAGVTVASARDDVHLVAAARICELAAAGGPSEPERIEPVYLREPDAKRWIERDHER